MEIKKKNNKIVLCLLRTVKLLLPSAVFREPSDCCDCSRTPVTSVEFILSRPGPSSIWTQFEIALRGLEIASDSPREA